MKIKMAAGFILVLLLSMLAVNTFADSGGWISGGTTGGGGSSSSGGGGGGGCSGELGYYDLWCQGYSWIFYKYVGGSNNSSAVNFRRDDSNNVISKACSEHGNTGGFWHLGYNMRALSYDGIGYFGDLAGNNSFVNGTYTYSTSPGSYGHAQTFDYKTIRDEYSYVYGERYITHSNSNLAHNIYKNGVRMYTASKYGSESEVLRAYQQAFKAIYPSANTPTSLPDNVYAFCWWPGMDGSSFQGTSRVMEGDKPWDETSSDKRVQLDPLWYPDSNGIKQKTASTLIVKDCDPTDGCLISFRHYLKRTSGSDSTKYTITRTINGSTSVINKDVDNNGVNSGNLVQLHPVTIYPGQKVCEILEFYADGKSDKVSTTVCAAAITTKAADLGVEIRDQQSSANYQNWRKDYVYAKPTDIVEVRGSYAPYYQAMHGVALPSKSKTNGFSNNNRTIGATFDANVDPDWKNIFSIRIDNDCRKNISGNVGSIDSYGGDDIYGFRVNSNDIGKKDVEAVINACKDAKNTPKKVTLAYSDKDWFVATVDTNVGQSEPAVVYIPYNFINETSIAMADDVVYAGEATSVSYDITVRPRFNKELDDTYATIVDGAEWKLEFCYGTRDTNCSWVNGASGQKMHDKGNDDNYIHEEEIVSNDSTVARFVVPDVPAGTKIWVRSAVYPRDSGGDDNIKPDYYDPNDPNSWAYSDWAEFTVAKKPSFQVWGGSIYSAGNISVNTSEKQHVFGVNNFEEVLKSKNNTSYIFGPWTELGLVASGSVVGLASGAGTGYAEASDALSVPIPDGHLGGSEEWDVNYCLRSTLSFANSNCNSSVGGLSGVSQGDNREALIARFVDDGGSDINRVDLAGDLDSVIVESGTNLYYKDGDLRIAGDVVYGGAVYSTLAEIPKTIIYSTGNIVIDCDVGRIDAVLIAKGDINTCPTGVIDGQEDRDNKDNSTPLKINGSTISDTLTLNRTYGAATGVNTVVPAEVINYDTTLYLWANGKSDVTRTGKIVTTYQKELSPRY